MTKKKQQNTWIIIGIVAVVLLFMFYSGGKKESDEEGVIMNPKAEYPPGTVFKQCSKEDVLAQSEINYMNRERLESAEKECEDMGKRVIYYWVDNREGSMKYPIMCVPSCEYKK